MQLDTLTLPDNFLWMNEYSWNPVSQSTNRSLTGALIVSEAEKQYGQSIILGDGENSWMTLGELRPLHELSKVINKTMVLTLDDGRSFNVIFDRRDGVPLSVEPVFPLANPADEHLYAVTIRLLTVGSPS